MYSTAGYTAINATLAAKPAMGPASSVILSFPRAGTFTYYCRNHAKLVQGQPVSGGTLGPGIAGQPMMGIVIIR